ncbi:hypothetical protein DMH88_08490 [Escherichia coli]|nr:hypothetical protein [Escherichia coli]
MPQLLRCLVNHSARWRNAIWYYLKVLKQLFCLFTFPFRLVKKSRLQRIHFSISTAGATCEHIFSFPSGAGIGFWRDADRLWLNTARSTSF